MHPATRLMIPALLLAACHGAEGITRSADSIIGDVVVTVAIPDGLEAGGIPGGLTIRRPRAEQTRRPSELTLTAAGGVSPIPLDRAHGTGAAAIRYGLKREAGGSGGDAVTLIAERRCGMLPLRLRLDTQVEENGTVDPAPVLAMLASARCSPSAGRMSGAG